MTIARSLGVLVVIGMIACRASSPDAPAPTTSTKSSGAPGASRLVAAPSAAMPSAAAPSAAAPSTTAPSAAPSASARSASALAAAPAVSVSAASTGPCPAEMTRAGRACIDRWEAHLVVLEGDTTRPHPHTERPDQKVQYAARSAAGAFPQAYISRLEAAAACSAAGKRLCTLREWYRACTGPQGWIYPYGPTARRGVCNVSKPHLLSLRFGSDSRRWKYDEHFNDPALDREPGFLARSGEYSECVTPEGAFDLQGNLHEWVADRVDADLPDKIPLRDDIREKIGRNTGHGIFMGGFFSTTSEHGVGCRFLTPGHEPKYHDYSTGFRCCRDAAPAPAGGPSG